MEIFDALGQNVEAAWGATCHDEQLFPALATQCLEAARLHERVTHGEILAWAASTDRLVHQVNAGSDFGQPPLTLYAGEGFYIEVLTWVDGSTSIHEHAFAGAFAVLEGSSCHSRFSFACTDQVDDHVRIGQLTFEDVELLERGDCRPILAGDGLVHSLFHLDRPSVSVVVRTPGLRRHMPQWSYLPPGLGFDRDHMPPQIKRRLDVLGAMVDLQMPEATSAVAALLDWCDYFTAVKALSVIASQDQDGHVVDPLLAKARRRFGARTDILVTVFEESRRMHNITGRRKLIQDADHRFLLALLLNVPTRSAILELVAQRVPDRDPVDVVVTWLAELSSVPSTDPAEHGPSVLGMQLSEVALALCDGFLRGDGEDEVRARLAANPATSGAETREVESLCMILPRTRLLRPLFGETIPS